MSPLGRAIVTIINELVVEKRSYRLLDVLRQRLTAEEQELFDIYDGRAALACHFLVWPAILAVIFYYSGRLNLALICAAIAAVALPIMLAMARRARRLRELAEVRYRTIMQLEREDDA